MINIRRNVLAALITAVFIFQPSCSDFQLLTISRSLTKTYWPVKQNLRIFKQNNLMGRCG